MKVKTYKYRIKDSSSSKALLAMSSKVNRIWNICIEACRKEKEKSQKNLTGYDLNKITSGYSKRIKLHSQTIQTVGQQIGKSAKQHKKIPKFRSYKRHLGWIPFKAVGVKISNDKVIFNGETFTFWKSREIEGKVKTGCFTQNSRGRWFVCFTCEVEEKQQDLTGKEEVGIDLGLKTKMTLSNGEQFSRENLTKKYEVKLAIAQRANKRKQVSKIHDKVKNTRLDWTHKTTTYIANKFSRIVVGDVESCQIVNRSNNLAKSVYDAGWFQLKQCLKYKAQMLGVEYIEVNEAYTTKTCSDCGKQTGPSGLSQLGVREWYCEHCGSVHSRDVNAAKNILRRGHATPMTLLKANGEADEGITGLSGR